MNLTFAIVRRRLGTANAGCPSDLRASREPRFAGRRRWSWRVWLGAAVAAQSVATASAQPSFTIDARAPAAAPERGGLVMGSPAANRTPDGRRLLVDSRGLLLEADGRGAESLGQRAERWLPVMGEFHYSRYPAEFWEQELLKMKAGGVQIVSTYVFWIHHEEVEGEFDWSGQRDLRRFVELCGRHGLYAWIRIGPWAHGEARNGGLPDWLLAKGPTRVSDPGYLSNVARFYGEIGRQLHGLLWKDGGPVVGIQIENEYTNRAANAGAAHIATLKRMAQEAGLDVPVYTVTGWDNTVYPPQIVLPVFGGYADEPWSGSRTELPPDTQGVFQFAPAGGNTGILQGSIAPGPGIDLSRYPRFTAELGGGAQVTYHRRVVIEPADVTAIAITALGSGANLLGYYMFHGGTQPDGRLTTLQESQATGYPNDVPVKSYDFQAPLGEFGGMAPSFRLLKTVHQFVADFGCELATMPRVLPDVVPTGLRDTTTLRVAARTNGDRGFLFFNNYVRHHPMPRQPLVQVRLRLPSGDVLVPAQPFDVPPQASFFWPVNLDLQGATLVYATAQPMARVVDAQCECVFFVAVPGVAAEFAFDRASVAALETGGAMTAERGGRTVLSGVEPSLTPIRLRTRTGRQVELVLLTPAQAENTWSLQLGGRRRMLLTPADVFAADETLHLRTRKAGPLALAVFPDFTSVPAGWRREGTEGRFAQYRIDVAERAASVSVTKLREAGPVAPVKLGPPSRWRGAVAQAPGDAEFARAAAWRIDLSDRELAHAANGILSIRYVGDVARLYAGDRLIDDNFYNGQPWDIGLRELRLLGRDVTLRLEILPLRADAPIYLPESARPDFRGLPARVELTDVTLEPEYEVTAQLPTGPAANRKVTH